MDRDELLCKISPEMEQYADSILEMYNAPFARYIGIELVSLEKDRCECSMELVPDLMNSMGRGHGGALYALMDHTFAILSNTDAPCTGQSGETKFYRPATGRITAVARPINLSRSLRVYSVEAFSEEGKLIASSTYTAFVLQR